MSEEEMSKELIQTATQLEMLSKKIWNLALKLERDSIRKNHNKKQETPLVK